MPGRKAPIQAREEELRPTAEVNMDDNGIFLNDCIVGDKVVQEVDNSGDSDNSPKNSYLMILRPSGKRSS